MTSEAVERVARALHWELFHGCVSWHDTADSCTTGSAEDRERARDLARIALVAAEIKTPWLCRIFGHKFKWRDAHGVYINDFCLRCGLKGR